MIFHFFLGQKQGCVNSFVRLPAKKHTCVKKAYKNIGKPSVVINVNVDFVNASHPAHQFSVPPTVIKLCQVLNILQL